ncbi:hypothetical protein HY041_04010 [Candidatus Roizmanbacteria bacterium]|nr:hypothetical protein [Candidatus Roizmanbacteria bacterium]
MATRETVRSFPPAILAIQPPRELEKKESLRTVELESFMETLFPEIHGTEVGKILSGMVASIDPLRTRNDEGEPNALFIKGSTVKRYLLGDPIGFWDISRIYQHTDQTQYQGEALDFIRKFAIGPRDIDFRYELTDGCTDIDAYRGLIYSLFDQGFTNQGNTFYKKLNDRSYCFEITETPIGGVHALPRKFYNVKIYVDDRFLIRADFGRYPSAKDKLGEMHDEYRIPLYTTPSEWYAQAMIRVETDAHQAKVTVFFDEINDRLINELDNPFTIKPWHSIFDLPMILSAKLKGAGLRVFWPQSPGKKSYSYAKLIEQFTQAEYLFSDPWLYLKYNENMLQRRSDFISEFLLYTTYDPFLFLQLGYDCRLFEIVPFDNYSINRKDFLQIMNFMKEEMTTKVGQMKVNPYRTSNIPHLSQLYKEMVLSASLKIEDTGPFMLLRAINRLLESGGRSHEKLPETLEQTMALFDPLRSSIVKRIKL